MKNKKHHEMKEDVEGKESEHKHTHTATKKEKFSFEKLSKNYWAISTIVLAVVVVVLLFLMYFPTASSSSAVSEEEAGQIIIDFASSQGLTAELIDVEEENGLYRVDLTIQGQDVPVYITKDGKNLVPSVVSLEDLQKQAQQADSNTNTQTQPTEVTKSDKPRVDLFVMSFCPYGNRGEDTLLPVYELLKEKVDWNINYIVSVSGDNVKSLHGQPEVDQNIREVCVKKEYGLDKFWEFVTYVNTNCGRDGSCWEDGAKEIGLDKDKIQSCFESEGLELMKNEGEISGAAGAQGSPTMLINGVKTNVVYQYENSEAYKQAICSAFITPPEECSQELESATSASSGGSC